MTKIQNSKFKIQNFIIPPILLLAIIFLFSCTSSTEVSKGSLIGSVALENETDHSGISVSLYELAYLDTTITRINNEYPHIGVIINQHTEFDHRLQTPIKTGTTAADGSFELKNIPTGTYNFVAQKAGYGFRYIYEISISNGDNLLEVKSEKGKVKSEKSSSPPLTREIPKDYFTGFTSHLSRGEASNSPFTSQECKMKKPIISTGMEKSHSYKEILSKNSACIPINRGKLRIQNSTFIRNSGLTLFPELHLSGDISEEVVVEPHHHLVCDDDVTFIPGSRLEIQPSAVVRIAPGADLTVMGNFKAQGEENNMFWVTSNDGFADDSKLKMKNVKSKMKRPVISTEMEKSPDFTSAGRDTLAFYNSMELSPLATVENDLIEWGKWDWGNRVLISSNTNCNFRNNLFRYSESGLYVNEAENITIFNITSYLCNSSSYGGIVAFNINELMINKNILINNYNGIYCKFSPTSLIENNFLANNRRGIWGLTLKGSIEHNEIIGNEECDIKLAGNTTQGEIEILYNNIFSDTGFIQYEQGSFSQFYILKINYNNFYSNDYFLIYDSSGYYHGVDINAMQNYYNAITDPAIIEEMIEDINIYNPAVVSVIYEPFEANTINVAGIQ